MGRPPAAAPVSPGEALVRMELVLRTDRATGLPELRVDSWGAGPERPRSVRLSGPLVPERGKDGVVTLVGDMRLESFGFHSVTLAGLSATEARAASVILRWQHEDLVAHRFSEVQRLARLVKMSERPSQVLKNELFDSTGQYAGSVSPNGPLTEMHRAHAEAQFTGARPFTYRVFEGNDELLWYVYLPSLKIEDSDVVVTERVHYHRRGGGLAKSTQSLFEFPGPLVRYEQSWTVKGFWSIVWSLRSAGAAEHGLQLQVQGDSAEPLVVGRGLRPVGVHEGAVVLGGWICLEAFTRREEVGAGDSFIFAESIWHQHLALLRLGLSAQQIAAERFGKWLANRHWKPTEMDREERVNFEAVEYWPLRRFAFHTEPFRYYIRLSSDKAVKMYVALHPHFDDLKFSLEPAAPDHRQDIEH